MLSLAKINYLWNHWGIELLVLANLGFQTILTFNGSRRRHTPGYKLNTVIWLAYFLVAKVSTFVLVKLMVIETQVQALLAPLMLMQMGNPDTITAFTVEDNQLGVRQIFGMVVQVALMIYILARSWTDSKTSFLYFPLSLAGIIKYAETSWALKSALHSVFGSNFAAIPQCLEAANLLQKLPQGERELTQARLILRAYYRFCCFRPHLEKWLYYPPDYSDPQNLFIRDLDYEDAFKITDSELGFMYDVLYTKAPILYTRKGVLLRFIGFLSLIAALWGFSVLFKDAFVYNIRVGFIYYVLIVSVILEVYQILRLPFSDWAIIFVVRHSRSCPILWRFLPHLAQQSENWRRWSNKMGQFDLLNFFMKKYYFNSRILRYWDSNMKIQKRSNLEQIDIPSKVKKLVVKELCELENFKGDGKFNERGRWTFDRCLDAFILAAGMESFEALKRVVFERPFDKSIFIWHITTSTFYHIKDQFDDSVHSNDMDAIKCLSDYMMYLMVFRPHVLSSTLADMVFDYFSEMFGPLISKLSPNKDELCRALLYSPAAENGVQSILNQYSAAETAVVGGWDPVRDVQELAQVLLKISNKDRWMLMGSMWVEMLGYAASNCDMEYHSEHIREGGELITHVWLLIAHNVTKYSTYKYEVNIPAASG